MIDKTKMESIIRSVTTVPSDFENEVPSYFVKTPQRVTSPIRGMVRLAAYERKTACTQVLVLGFSPSGSSVCFHLRPRNNWAVTPNTNEKAIHHQFMPPLRVDLSNSKSKLRYIHQRIPLPRSSGNAMLNAFFMIFLFFNG